MGSEGDPPTLISRSQTPTERWGITAWLSFRFLAATCHAVKPPRCGAHRRRAASRLSASGRKRPLDIEPDLPEAS